ncbi:MAG: GNAT family N-acetyltransferase [Candidatus Pacebacteria bacterium]|nr:GNAT family N-acetyltransferase [Candidatus Paceibacterota bacterium]
MKKIVSIRPVRFSDAEEMCEAMNVDALQNFQFFERKVTVERQQAYLSHAISSNRDKLFSVLCDGKIIGTCGLHEIDRQNKNARVGIMIFSQQNRGQHFASRALRKLLALAFGKLGLHKVYLKVFKENTASCTKYAHLGFQFETVLREQYRLRRKYHDMVVMSMFARDWRKEKGRS